MNMEKLKKALLSTLLVSVVSGCASYRPTPKDAEDLNIESSDSIALKLSKLGGIRGIKDHKMTGLDASGFGEGLWNTLEKVSVAGLIGGNLLPSMALAQIFVGDPDEPYERVSSIAFIEDTPTAQKDYFFNNLKPMVEKVSDLQSFSFDDKEGVSLTYYDKREASKCHRSNAEQACAAGGKWLVVAKVTGSKLNEWLETDNYKPSAMYNVVNGMFSSWALIRTEVDDLSQFSDFFLYVPSKEDAEIYSQFPVGKLSQTLPLFVELRNMDVHLPIVK